MSTAEVLTALEHLLGLCRIALEHGDHDVPDGDPELLGDLLALLGALARLACRYRAALAVGDDLPG